MNYINQFIQSTFPDSLTVYIQFGFYCVLFIIAIILLQYVTKTILATILSRAHRVRKINIIKYAIDNKLPKYTALIIPFLFLKLFIPTIFSDFPRFVSAANKLLAVYLILTIVWIALSCARVAINLLQERSAFSNKPMQSYIQVISIILYGLGFIVLFAYLTNQSIATILAGLGAASAVTMLVFQDSIKGFVGSIQMTANNMVELGDWITVDKFKADGTVEEINLTTVKVRNFDNTITTLPTYSLISDSFQNWAAMTKSGGRRIKRSLFVKQASIKLLSTEELNKFNSHPYLQTYFSDKKQKSADNILVTNNDLFMAYALFYLKNHPEIKQDQTCMVRQLAPSTMGLPIEIYAFTIPVWIEHERIAAEIVNHLISAVHLFDLELFENISDSYQNTI